MASGRELLQAKEKEEGGKEGREDEPEDLEDLVDFRVAGDEGQTGSHLGKDGSAGPDVDLCVF